MLVNDNQPSSTTSILSSSNTTSVNSYSSTNSNNVPHDLTSSYIFDLSSNADSSIVSDVISSTISNSISSTSDILNSAPQITSSVNSSTVSSVTSSVLSSPSSMVSNTSTNNKPVTQQKSFTSGIWYSFEDLDFKNTDVKGFKEKIDKMFDDAVDLGADAVICQVRPFADALYYSDYFPMSEILTGTQGKDPGYDALDYMVSAAHKRELQIHAWLNPYRVTLWNDDHTRLADSNPAKIWLTDSDTENDRYVLKYNNRIYFNPSVKQVQTLILNGVREIVKNYDVDGIHIDDYFYPSEPAVENNFDKLEYDTYVSKGGKLSLDDWRRNNVDVLVSGMYRAVKAIDKSVIFGVSPSYHISSNGTDDNYKYKYADIAMWMSNTGYIDYIAPQLYFGYDYPRAEIRFDYLLNRWMFIKRHSNLKIYIGLAAYKIGDSSADLNSGEWISSDDILARQALDVKKANGNGVFIFAYSSIMSKEELNTAQRDNLAAVLKNTK